MLIQYIFFDMCTTQVLFVILQSKHYDHVFGRLKLVSPFTTDEYDSRTIESSHSSESDKTNLSSATAWMLLNLLSLNYIY